MNDSTGYSIPILIYNLTLDSSRIVHVNCKPKESIRTYFLKNGIATINDPRSATLGELNSQGSARINRLGFWANEEFYNQVAYAQKRLLKKENLKSINRTPRYIVFGKSRKRKKTVTAKESIEMIDSTTFSELSAIEEKQRIFIYQYTDIKRHLIVFRKVPFGAKTDPMEISTYNLKIDYTKLDTVYCFPEQSIIDKLLFMGVISLKELYPDVTNASEEKFNRSHRKNYWSAQNHRRGIWHKFDPTNMRPDIIRSYPIIKEDPLKPNLTTYQQLVLGVKKAGRYIWNNYAQIFAILGSINVFIKQIKKRK